jgi:hypothetical protein
LVAWLAAVFLAAQLYRLRPRVRIRLETGDHFDGDFPLDESFNVVQESALIHADQ